MSSIFKPVVDADDVYGEGDWRPVFGEGPRRDSWKLYMVGKQSIEHKLRGVILPSLDFSLSIHDSAFPTSVGACWTDQPQKGLERHFSANAFALPLMIYPFLGPNKDHWLSPGNLKNMIGNDDLGQDVGADAFDDLNKSIRRNKQLSQEKREFYLKAPSMKEDALIPSRTVRYFALTECRDKENDWHLAAVACTASAYSYLIEQMRWRHQDQGPARDPNWPQYMLGDPTDPKAALEWHVDKVLLDPKDQQETNSLCFTERREFLDPDQKVRAVSQAVLDRRFNMVDPANWNIPTYEEQVEFMMANYDPAVTADMIRAACAYRCGFEIPKQRPERVQLMGGTDSSSSDSGSQRGGDRTERASDHPGADPMAAVTGGGLAPRSSAPPMPNLPPPATASPTETTEPWYWAGRSGEKPSRMTVRALQAVVDAGQSAGFKVNVDGKADWQNLDSCGLVQASPTVPDEGPPTVPTTDVAPTVPTETRAATPSTGKKELTLAEMASQLFPDRSVYDALTDEQKVKADALVHRAWEATERGTKPDFPSDIVEDLLSLLG